MEEKSTVELKALINYVALVENINWAKRRLEVLEERHADYYALSHEKADEALMLLAESYPYFSVVYDNDVYSDVVRELLPHTSEALERDEDVTAFMRTIGITREMEAVIKEERIRNKSINKS